MRSIFIAGQDFYYWASLWPVNIPRVVDTVERLRSSREGIPPEGH